MTNTDNVKEQLFRELAKALKKERDFISAILDTANALIVVFDLEGRIVRFNRACERLTGYTFEEVQDKYPWTLFFDPEAAEPTRAIFERLQRGEYPIAHENHWLAKDGQRHTISWSSTILLDQRDRVQYIVSTGIDISEWKRAEEELKNSEEQFKLVFEFAPDAYYLNDLAGRFVNGNRTAERLTGYSRAELIGKNLLELNLLSSDQLPEAAAKLGKAAEGKPTGPDEFTLTRKDGGQVTVEIQTYPARIKDQTLVLGIARDITGRKQTDKEQEKLIEELNAFGHTVAHDLQAILARMIGFADLLAAGNQTLPAEKLQEYSQLIARNGRKMSDIIDDLLLLSGVRQREVTPAPLDMSAIVAEVKQRLADLIEQYRAEIVLPGSWLTALGYAPWVEEVWFNYLSNGVKYGGDPPRLELGSTELPNGLVKFWVRDNGAGLSPEEQAKLFKPFTQLHQLRDKGHGLGLSIVQRIVEKLGGQTGVESAGAPGQGCVFSFTLPAAK